MANNDELISDALQDGVIEYDKFSLLYKCRLCVKPLTGEGPVLEHLKGSKHEEAAVRYAIGHFNDVSESLQRLLSPEIQEAAAADNLEVRDVNVICRVCNKSLTGLTQIHDHLLGIKHIKQLGIRSLAGNAPVQQLGIGSFTSNPEQQPPLAAGMVEPTGHAIKQAWNDPRYDIPPIQAYGGNPDQITNGISPATSSCPRIPVPSGTPGNSSVDSTGSERSPVRFPNPGIPLESASTTKTDQHHGYLFTPASSGISGGQRRSNDADFRLPEMNRRPLPLIGQGSNKFASSDNLSILVEQALKDQVIEYNNDTMRYRCQVCKEDFQAIDVHLKHKTHKDEGACYVIRNAGQAPPSLIDLLPDGAVDAAKAGILIVTESNLFHCRACDTSSNGVATLKQHLEGSGHLKKSSNRSQLPAVTMQGNAISLQLPSFTRQPPPPRLNEQHLAHTTSTVDIVDEVAEAFRKGIFVCTDDPIGDQVMCPVCNTSVNGRKNMQEHLNGQKHKKKFKQHIQSFTDQDPSPLNSNAMEANGDTPNQPKVSQGFSKVEPYKVDSNPRGHVHIFNYMFTGHKNQRTGAEHDTMNIMVTFNRLGYEVFCHENQQAEETEKELERIRQDPGLKKVDVLIMFFLSHGREPEDFFANDWERINLKDVRNKFTDTNCPFMKKKPKIIFANFCRGEYNELLETDTSKYIDVPRDMVTLYASLEGIKALRKPNKGTHFVISLCKVLKNHAHEYNLREIYEVLDPECKGRGGRTPQWVDNRFRTFYFNPLYG